MKIYLSHSSNYDYETELYAPLKSSVIARKHQILFPHDKENIVANSKSLIQHSDLVIAEVSNPSTGQGIELGWANNGDAPVVCIYKTDSKLSSSLKFVTQDFIEYTDHADMIKKLEHWLEAKK
jgi:nucleoside 2-deoxyribosyltransferase